MLYNIAEIDIAKNGVKRSYYDCKVYELYRSMIQRCYSKVYLEKHPTYKNCKVCDRWLKFSHFLEDLPKIDGYENWKQYINKRQKRRSAETIVLDKDLKSKDEKIYSLETCQFISLSVSASEVNKRNAKYLTGQFSKSATQKRVKNTDFTKFFEKRDEYVMQYAKSVIATEVATGKQYFFESIHATARWAGVDKKSIRNLIRNGHCSKKGFTYSFLENGSSGD